MRRRLSARWHPVLMLGISAIALTGTWVMRVDNARLPEAERQLRVAEQVWRKRAALLQDASLIFTDGETDTDGLQVAVLESLDTLARMPTVELVRYRVSESTPLMPTDALLSSITTMRLTIELRVVHADDLLQVLQTLAQRLLSHPSEVRGCSLHRYQPALALRASCTVDIYHWTTTPSLGTSNSVSSAGPEATLGDLRLFFTAEERQALGAQQVANAAGPIADAHAATTTRKPAANRNQDRSGERVESAASVNAVTYTGYVSSNGQLQVLFNGVPWHAASGRTWTADADQPRESATRLEVTRPTGGRVSLTVGQRAELEPK